MKLGPPTKYAGLMPYARRQLAGLTAILALSLMVAAAGGLQPWPLKVLVDYGVERQPVPPWLQAAFEALLLPRSPRAIVLVAAVGSICVFAVTNALQAALDWRWTVVGRRMMNDLAADLFHHYQRQSLLRHRQTSVGDALSRIGTDSWSIQQFTSALMIGPIRNALTLAVLGVAGWQLSPSITLLSLALAPLLGFSSWFFGRKLKAQARRMRETQSRLTSFVQQTLTAIPVVQAFSREDFNRRRFEVLAGEATEQSQQRAVVDSAYGMATGIIVTAGMAIVLFAGGRQVLSGALSVGGLLVFISYIRSLQGAAEGLLSTYGALKPVEASLERVLEVLDGRDRLPERPDAVPLPPIPPAGGRRLSFEHVTFGYDPDRPVLTDINLEVLPGQSVALVGETGAGKSTLISLIPRFFDPVRGRVAIDGVDLGDVRLASAREQVALVLQEPFILPIPIAENIAYGRPDATRHEIEEAARAACAHDFILRLPCGYDTVVGERGTTLSGGEKQRLAIARAFLKNVPILILDEPSSALDIETERQLLEALRRLMVGRTTLIIGHRLSTVCGADEIVVLHQGTIVERGTHERLLERRGMYYAFYAVQAAAGSPEFVA